MTYNQYKKQRSLDFQKKSNEFYITFTIKSPLAFKFIRLEADTAANVRERIAGKYGGDIIAGIYTAVQWARRHTLNNVLTEYKDYTI